MAFIMETQLEKPRILELYLNSIEWGEGIFRIEAASRAYFGKSVSRVTPEEGARLTAIIPNPLAYRPDDKSPYLTRKPTLF